MKYAWPCAELETRFERQTNKERGKFSGASGSAIAKSVSPDFNSSIALSMISSFVVLPASRASSAKDKLFLLKDRKSTRLNSSHVSISYAVFCLKKKKIN